MIDDDEPTKTEGLNINNCWKDEYPKNGTIRSAGYHDSNGICYFTAEDYIQESIFGFCGCGDPEENLKYIRDHMQLLHEHKASRFTLEHRFTYTPAEYLVWYLLDKLNLTEHGGAVPGWLTESGEELLHDLNIMYPIEAAK